MRDFRGVAKIIVLGVMAIGIGAAAGAQVHSADTSQDYLINLSELLRVIQFFNSAGFHCAAPPESTEDGYAPGLGDTACAPHDSDYNPQDWSRGIVSLRAIRTGPGRSPGRGNFEKWFSRFAGQAIHDGVFAMPGRL